MLRRAELEEAAAREEELRQKMMELDIFKLDMIARELKKIEQSLGGSKTQMQGFLGAECKKCVTPCGTCHGPCLTAPPPPPPPPLPSHGHARGGGAGGAVEVYQFRNFHNFLQFSRHHLLLVHVVVCVPCAEVLLLEASGGPGGLVTAPQFSANFPKISRNFPRMDLPLPDRQTPPLLHGRDPGCSAVETSF